MTKPPEEDKGVARTFAKRAFVFLEGDRAEHYGVVEGGRVKLVHGHPGGKETILDIVEVGGTLCSGAVWSSACYCCSAVADEDKTVVRFTSRARVRSNIERESPAAAALMGEAAERAMTMCKRVSESNSGSVPRRIAALLLRMAERSGQPVEEGTLIATRLTRQNLADLCGTTVESAIRVMRALEKEGVVISRKEHVVIPSLQRLEEVWRR